MSLDPKYYSRSFHFGTDIKVSLWKINVKLAYHFSATWTAKNRRSWRDQIESAQWQHVYGTKFIRSLCGIALSGPLARYVQLTKMGPTQKGVHEGFGLYWERMDRNRVSRTILLFMIYASSSSRLFSRTSLDRSIPSGYLLVPRRKHETIISISL